MKNDLNTKAIALLKKKIDAIDEQIHELKTEKEDHSVLLEALPSKNRSAIRLMFLNRSNLAMELAVRHFLDKYRTWLIVLNSMLFAKVTLMWFLSILVMEVLLILFWVSVVEKESVCDEICK